MLNMPKFSKNFTIGLDKALPKCYHPRMNILWHSVSPFCQSGYGQVTRQIVRRLVALGHKVVIATKHRQYGSINWGGVEVVDGTNIPMMNLYTKAFDYIITLWDIWKLGTWFDPEKWVAYIPVQTKQVSDATAEALSHTRYQIAMSRHGESELQKAGFSHMYAPHGTDFGTMRVLDSHRSGKTGYIIGSVGINYEHDSKGFSNLITAFKEFKKRHSEASLYLHTQLYGDKIAQLDTEGVSFPNQLSLYLNHFDNHMMSVIYNSLDLFCLPTYGEGFGLPTLEAQACGTQVAVTDNTTGPELCKSGILIKSPSPVDILEALEWSYSNRLDPYKTRESVKEYDWDTIWNTYWVPILNKLQESI